MARSVALNNANEWTVVSESTAGSRRSGRRAPGPSSPIIPAEFIAPQVSIDRVLDLAPTAQRRAAGVPMVDLSVVPDADETYALAIRHASGALTFHSPDVEVGKRRGRAQASATYRFRVTLRSAPSATDRRSIVGSAIKVAVLKVAGKIADALLPTLAAKAEAALWKKAGRSEG